MQENITKATKHPTTENTTLPIEPSTEKSSEITIENTLELKEPVIKVFVPVKIFNEAQKKDNWQMKLKRKNDLLFVLEVFLTKQLKLTKLSLPLKITFTRISERAIFMDDDNLRFNLKYAKDFVADLIIANINHTPYECSNGRNDGNPKLFWDYAQRTERRAGLYVEIEQL